MIKMNTLEAVVRAIYNELEYEEVAKILANEAALYFNTAIICQTKGVEEALNYFKTTKRTDLYESYLWGDPTEK
jgi:hypothetical protein